MEFYKQKAKVWTPLRGVKMSALRRAQVQDFIVARAAKHPRSAMDEVQFLKRVLREAKERGQHIDDAILSIKPVKHTPRRGRALDVDQLYELASWFPEHVSRLVSRSRPLRRTTANYTPEDRRCSTGSRSTCSATPPAP
jgi:hypothetical protein